MELEEIKNNIITNMDEWLKLVKPCEFESFEIQKSIFDDVKILIIQWTIQYLEEHDI